MSDNSRVEQLLRNALGDDIYEVTPQSRVEELLQELNEAIEGMGSSVSPEDIATAVSAYLDEHLTNPTNPPVDTSLTIAGAAADAQKTGVEIAALKEDFTQMTTATAEDVGKALKVKTVADGKVTEWEFGEAGGSGGLSGEAVTLLITILTAGVYTSDQSANIEALLLALGGLPVAWEKVGKTLVFSNVDAITSITQSGTMLVCA